MFRRVFITLMIFVQVSAFAIDAPSIDASTTATSFSSNLDLLSNEDLVSETSKKKSVLGSGDYFKLNPITDPILVGTGASLFIASLFLQKKKTQEFSGTIFNRSDVNFFDYHAMRPYSKKLDIAGSVFVALSVASPVVFFASDKYEWLTIFTMYAETMLLAYATKDFIKSLVYRPRPYMYFDGYPQKKVDDGSWRDSFPSGHTTMAFAAAAFTSYVFYTYFPSSLWNIAVSLGSVTLASTVATLRILSANHFSTDMLAGAGIGTVIGLAVPLLHRIGINSKQAKKNQKGSVEDFSIGSEI